jgi:hypothetical protein
MIKYTKLRALAKAASSDGLLLDMLTVYERAEEGWPPTRLDLSSARVLDLLTRYLTLFAEAWVQPATLWARMVPNHRPAGREASVRSKSSGRPDERGGGFADRLLRGQRAGAPTVGAGVQLWPAQAVFEYVGAARPRSSGRPKVYLSATARPTALATIATNQRHGLYAVVGALEEEPNAGLEDGSKDE